MKRWLILALLLVGVSVNAQTTVTGSGVQDANGNLYATFQDQNGTSHSATVSAFLVAQSGAIPKANGVPMNPALGPFSMDSTGSFSITVTPNSVILPSGSQWQFTICGTSVNLGPQPSPLLQVCFNTALITVITPGPQDITTQANAAAKLLGPKLGGGGGGGSGTVGPGTPGTFAGFSTSTQVTNGDCTFDFIHPDRCPNGINTAANGDHDEWGVDSGGAIQGRALCITGNRLVQTCAIGATSGFVGIADSTVPAGGTVSICWAGRCNVTTTNNTTRGDWMVMSVSVAGEMDDVGATKPTSGVQTFPVDSTVTAGQLVLTTLLSPDSLNAMVSGSGTITPCGPGIAYYASLGTVINCIPNPTTPANVPQSLIATPGGTPAFALGGVPVNTQTGVSYIWLPTDRLSFITGSNAGATAWTGPALTNNFAAAFLNLNAGLITFTPASGLVNGNANQIIPQNWFGFHYTNGANSWMPVTPTIAAFPQCLDTAGNHLNFSNVTGTFICGTSNSSSATLGSSPNVNVVNITPYTVLNTDNLWDDKITVNGAATVILPQASSVTIAPRVASRVFRIVSCSTCTSGTFGQTAGNRLLVSVFWVGIGNVFTTLNGFSDSAGDTWSRIQPDLVLGNGGSVAFFQSNGIVSTGANTIQVTFSGATTIDSVIAEYTTTFSDQSGELSTTATSGTIGLSIPVSNANEVAVLSSATATGCPSGWVTVQTPGDSGVMCDRLISSQPTVLGQATSNGSLGAGFIIADYGISGIVGFTAGWEFYVENATPNCSDVKVLPTTSKINTALLSNLTEYHVPCGMTARFRSDGANYEMFQLTGTDGQSLSATYTNATTGFTSTTLTFQLQAGETKSGSCHLTYQGTATTAAPILQFTGSAAPNTVTASLTETLTSGSSPTFYSASTTGATFAIGLGATAIVSTATDMPMQLDFGIINGATAGIVTLQAKSNGAGTITFEKGSVCVLY